MPRGRGDLVAGGATLRLPATTNTPSADASVVRMRNDVRMIGKSSS